MERPRTLQFTSTPLSNNRLTSDSKPNLAQVKMSFFTLLSDSALQRTMGVSEEDRAQNAAATLTRELWDG